MAPMKSSTWEAPILCHCSSSFVSWRLPWDARQNSIGSQINPVTYLLPTPTCASLRRYWATIPRSISPRVCSVLRRGSGLITSSESRYFVAQGPFSSLSQREEAPLNTRCAPPSAVADAGNGGTLNCAPSADAVAGRGDSPEYSYGP